MTGATLGAEHRQRMMDHKMLICGDLRLDLEARLAHAGPDRVILTFEEFELLQKLVQDPGRAFTREELRPVRPLRPSSERSVDVRVMRLRQKLRAACGFRIETVPQVGYRCAAAETPPRSDGAVLR